MDLKELDALEIDIQKHWYYKTKAMAMVAMMQGIAVNEVLDIGAGSGFFSQYLLKHTSAQLAYCVDIGYQHNSDESFYGKSIKFRSYIEELSPEIVLFMDVLEHVDNDVALLEEYIKKIPLGTHFLITVPAFNFMWSRHDEFLGHKRRYTLRKLEDIVRKSGLTVKTSNYFFGIVLPIALVTRFLQKIRSLNSKSHLSKHSTFTNFILILLCKLELSIMKFNRLAGLSVFCLAQKK